MMKWSEMPQLSDKMKITLSRYGWRLVSNIDNTMSLENFRTQKTTHPVKELYPVESMKYDREKEKLTINMIDGTTFVVYIGDET